MEPTIHCNACGRVVPVRRAMGREWRTCSLVCVHEMDWRAALSTMGEAYRPSPETEAWAKSVLGDASGDQKGGA